MIATGSASSPKSFGARCQIIGDDFLVTNAERVKAAVGRRHRQRGAHQAQSGGDADRDARRAPAGKEAGFGTIVSARSGESEDVTIAHLAVGWDAGQLKVGSFSRSERMAKWNEVLRIEEMLGRGGVLRRMGGASRSSTTGTTATVAG